MEVYIKSNILRQQGQEWTVHHIENGQAVPLFYLRSSGFVEGVAAEVADVNKTIIMEVVQDTYLPGRRMQLRTANRLNAGSIEKDEHPLDSHKGAVNKFLQSFSKRLSDTFVAKHGDRKIAQGERLYPAEEFCIHANVAKRTGGHKSVACKVARLTAGSSQKVASALLGKPGVDEGVLQDVYTLQLPPDAALHDQARLVLMAILMQEASFAPHVALPPIISVPPAVTESQGWAMSSTPEPATPPVRAATSTNSLSLPSLCLNLKDEATALLHFLHEVDGAAWLHSEEAVQRVVRRYEKFWLPILAIQAVDALRLHRQAFNMVAAPMDIAWAWLAHSLEPETYRKDFHELTNAMPPTSSTAHRRDKEALAAGAATWAKQFPNEPFEVKDSSPKQVAAYPHSSTCDIAAAMRRLRAFLYQARAPGVALPHWLHDPTLIDKAVTGYRRFLALHKRYPTTNLVPTTGIELVWQAHMANHDAYFRDTVDESDRWFAPNKSAETGGEGTPRKGGLARTKQLYESNFSEAYAQAGAGYRGVPPPDRHLTGAAAVPLKTAGALTTYKITQHLVKHKRQPLAMHIAEDMPAGGVAICLLAETSKCAKRYRIWLCHNGPDSTQASVHVLDSKGVLVATARLVGKEQLPIKETGGMGAATWAKQFPNEPFEVKDSSPKQVAAYPHSSTCDIAAAMRRLRAFLYQARAPGVALPHWLHDPTLIDKAVTGYRRFLALHKRYPTTNLVPTTGIELVWQAHMANHDAYFRDTVDESDRWFAPNKSAETGGEGTPRKGGLARTKQLYESNFSEAYAQAGAGYRGVPPPDRHLTGAAAVPLKTAGALTTYKITQHLVKHKRQPLAMHIAEDMPAGGVAICLLAETSKCAKRYRIWLCHNGPDSTQASVHVLDSKGVLVATARLVGKEQLPIKETGGMVGATVNASGRNHFSNPLLFTPNQGFSALPDQAYPALLSYANPRHPSERTAFLISSRSHDWGVASAVWHGHVSSERTHVSSQQRGVINIGSTGEPGHLAVRLCRLGEAGLCLAYKTSKGQGGSKFSFSAPSNSSPSIILKMETPTEVSVAAGENAACALAFAGAVSLQAMILGLPLAGLSKSKFAAGLLAAHGVSLAAVLGRDDLRMAPGSLSTPSPDPKGVACEEEPSDEEEADTGKLKIVSLTAGDALENIISSPKSSAEKRPYAKWQGTAQHAYGAAVPEAELSVYEGEQVEVVGESDGWLHCVASNGDKGPVPASIVTRGAPDQHAPISSPFAAKEVQQHAKPEFNPLAEPDLLSAVCHGTPQHSTWSNEFSEQQSSPFHQPQTPTAFDRSAGFGDTYEGTASGGAKADIVAIVSRLRPEDQADGRSLSTPANGNRSCHKQTYTRVICDFEAESEEELSVVAGDEVAVIGKEDNGWIHIARAKDGKEGLVPVSYLSSS
ncbi:probable glycine-rich domain-containing protein 1 at N-terminal half [Coccomyxa sp. Obi]|nr:probable glycine-rich domain-containing protein 1 at N-terminal half [Coccomyxa sp. Obi]